MGLANKMNAGKRETVASDINTKELEYFKVKELVDFPNFPIVLKGFFIQDGKYGRSVTAVGHTIGINLPKRYVEMFEAFSDEEVEQIKAGCLGISNISEFDSKNGKTVSIEFVDLEPEELPFK